VRQFETDKMGLWYQLEMLRLWLEN
jgi:hypothetical protein